MLEKIISFADRYKALPMFVTAALGFGVTSYKAHLLFAGDEANTYLIEEQKRMAQHHVRPTEYYVTYHSIRIEGRTQEIVEGRLVEVFIMNSDVTRDKQAVRMTWRDTAAFRNAEGELIERNRPCEQVFPEPGLPKIDCKGTDGEGWYQHQWWRADMAKKDGRSWEPWKYKQKLIPKGASAIQVCGFYEIRVHTGFIGPVDKIMNVCTKWYDLADIPEAKTSE